MVKGCSKKYGCESRGLIGCLEKKYKNSLSSYDSTLEYGLDKAIDILHGFLSQILMNLLILA